MSSTIIRPQDRTEWLKCREGGIGSSEVATIIGLNPWETPYQLWRRKIGLDAPKQENFAMRAGHYLEDAVSLFWQDATGHQVIKSSAGDWLVRDDERPFLQVSPDRTYWLKDMPHSNENKGILEIKTTQKTIDEDDIPKYWFVQVQYQLGVAGYDFGSLAWLTSGRDFGYKDLAFVPDFFGWLVEEVERFWRDNVLGKQEPTAANVQDVLIKYNRHTDGKIVEVNEEIFSAYNELKMLRRELSDLEERKAALEDKIKLGFGDAETISFGGQTLATWKAPKPSSKFDTKAFTAENPDMAKQYMVETQGSRRFLLK